MDFGQKRKHLKRRKEWMIVEKRLAKETRVTAES